MEFFQKFLIERSAKNLIRLAVKIAFTLFFFIIVGQPYSQDEEKKP